MYWSKLYKSTVSSLRKQKKKKKKKQNWIPRKPTYGCLYWWQFFFISPGRWWGACCSSQHKPVHWSLTIMTRAPDEISYSILYNNLCSIQWEMVAQSGSTTSSAKGRNTWVSRFLLSKMKEPQHHLRGPLKSEILKSDTLVYWLLTELASKNWIL